MIREYWHVPNGINLYLDDSEENKKLVRRLLDTQGWSASYEKEGKVVGWHFLFKDGVNALKRLKVQNAIGIC